MTDAAAIPEKLVPDAAKPPDNGDDRYRDGIIVWETSEDARVPFQLKFTNTTQVRYLNTLSSVDTFTLPYGGGFTPYTAGLSGWVPMLQTILAF